MFYLDFLFSRSNIFIYYFYDMLLICHIIYPSQAQNVKRNLGNGNKESGSQDE